MIIAVDGTTASGKGTLARMLAAHFGLPHLDTGLLYRAAALAAMRNGVDPADQRACADVAAATDPAHFTTAELRSDATGMAASRIAAYGAVRKALIQRQRQFAHRPEGAVLDGRDIGCVICPEADVKFWLHADLARRAERRRAELTGYGLTASHTDIIADMQKRDNADADRKIAPAQRATDAIVMDTGDLNPEQMLEQALTAIGKLRPTPTTRLT